MLLKYFYIPIFILLISAHFSFAEYPEIKVLNNSSFLFRQLTDDITNSYVLLSGSRKMLPLTVFSYRIKNDETLFQVASRVNLPYETISTLNRISSINEFSEQDIILIPNQPALFIPENPESDLELLLSARIYDISGIENKIRLKTNNTSNIFYYIIDTRFNNTERAFFLNTFFRFPLQGGRISSRYGNRINPISGNYTFHSGIDITAPEGAPVFASGTGIVSNTGYNNILGNFIIIQHPGSFETVYGHLKQTFVLLGDNIRTSTVIGEVGNTGYSTGPHLHFEVRQNESSMDPLKYFNRNR